MRAVAGEAPLLHGVVFEPVSGYRLRNFLMAAEAKFAPVQEEVVLILRTVGVVALHANPIRHDFVDALRLAGDDPVVTLQADFVRILRQQLAVGGGVRVVAVGAVPLLHRGVEKGKLHLLPEALVAVEADLSFRAEFQTELVLGTRDRTHGQHRHPKEE
jgi:hypothetical protein